MLPHKSDFLNILHERGFIHQITHQAALEELTRRKEITAYIGFDCTGPSLHVGSLIQIMVLYWLQHCGHRPLVLMGGGTTKVGDPSGKDETRKLLDEATISANMQSIRTIFKHYIQFEEDGGTAKMVNNADWLDGLNYIEFLRDYGQHFSINRMLTMDSVKLRLEREQNLSFLEFNYMILQAYDFVKLNEEYDCQLQIGGSDQWGNIVNGIELSRRLRNQSRFGHTQPDEHQPDQTTPLDHDLYGLTTPLITTASGAKMGKSASGAVWLNADILSPFDYWQFWRNTEDADVGRFLKLFTDLPMDEIRRLEALQGAEINEAKKILANEATKLCHGAQAAHDAAETARRTFEEGGAGSDLKTITVSAEQLQAGIPAFALFVLAGLKDSNGEARKLIEGGGGRINDEKLTDPRALITPAHLTAGGYIKLSSGKKHHVLVKMR